ncbi:uncharacterized protein LOC106658890 [Trichogramma pretiosum]|uniref:Adipokinetic hormone n=1 Tax=Trichogramma kaykai TaxID=54128 RepID=A0ABD2VZC3_9HYME|nr:uncharacterized protein LOC106658890 [Trichogramma pretiosum]
MSKHSRLVICFFFIVCLLQLSMSQVTLSRGWGPGAGKRAVSYDSDCQVNAKSLQLIFHLLMPEVKRLLGCDHQTMINYLQGLDRP